MRKWISFGCVLLLATLIPLPVSAQQSPVPLGTSDAPYGYYEYLPPGYNNDTVPRPVVIFLHGADERGDGTSELYKVLTHGVPNDIHNGVQYPFIAISPQSPNFWWSVAPLDDMVEYVKSHYRVDPDRIYLTGISMGGGGVWEYAKAHPEKIAAILPICGADSTPDGASLVDVPAWAFHAWGDGFVEAKASIQWVDAIAGALAGGAPTDVMASYPGTFSGLPSPGNTSDADRTASYDDNTGSWLWEEGIPESVPEIGDHHPILTLYSDGSHFIWPRVYGSEVVWDWLLAQSRAEDDGGRLLIVPTAAGAAEGVPYFPMEEAFDAQPTLNLAGEPEGGIGGSDAPLYEDRVGYIDFGPEWYKVRITSTWTRYRTWSLDNQTPYAELWWDDDKDTVNDGSTETEVNFNTAQNLNTGLTEPWVRDRDLETDPVVPQARYLLCRTPVGMTNRAKEYAIIGFINPNATP